MDENAKILKGLIIEDREGFVTNWFLQDLLVAQFQRGKDSVRARIIMPENTSCLPLDNLGFRYCWDRRVGVSKEEMEEKVLGKIIEYLKTKTEETKNVISN